MNKFLFPILSLFAAVGLYFLYIGPTYEIIKQHQEEEAKFDSAFLDVANAQAVLEELESSYASISKEDLHKLDIFLPQKIDIIRAVQNIEGIIKAHNVSMNNVSVGTNEEKTNDEKKVKSHTISFSLNSKYEVFLNIISDIERSLQLLNVSSIHLDPASRNNESNESEDVVETSYGINLVLYSFE